MCDTNPFKIKVEIILTTKLFYNNHQMKLI